MAEYEGKIETYSLNINSPQSRVIHLRGSFGMAFVNLVADPVAHTNRKKDGEDQFYVYLPADDWGPLVDMLRYESPVNFFYSDETKVVGIFTDREIVGEGNE